MSSRLLKALGIAQARVICQIANLINAPGKDVETEHERRRRVAAAYDRALGQRLRMLREYGWRWRERYISDVPGTNTRLDDGDPARQARPPRDRER